MSPQPSLTDDEVEPMLLELILDPESPSNLPSQDIVPNFTPQINLNVLVGMPASETFRVYGSINHHRVMILVDGGSTHNFVQSCVAKFLNLPTSSTPSLQVMLGNRSIMDCDTICPQIPISIQGHRFTIDLFSLPLSGTDIVLWVQWLKQLGRVTTYYNSLTMTFSHLGHLIALHADVPIQPASVLAQQVK